MIRDIGSKYTLKNIIIDVVFIGKDIVYESGSGYCFSDLFKNHRQ